MNASIAGTSEIEIYAPTTCPFCVILFSEEITAKP